MSEKFDFEKGNDPVGNPLFQLGQIVATPGALEALEKAGQTYLELIIRHVAGDFGTLSEEDKQANEDAIKDGSRILSAFFLKDGTKLWCITEAMDDDGNRAATTLLLPEEY